MQDDTKKLIELSERIAVETDTRVNKDTRGHVWKTNARGHVDVYVGDFHNNITCANCGYVYCIACHNRPQKNCKK